MRSLAWAVGLTLAGSLGGVLVASALLFFNDRLRVTARAVARQLRRRHAARRRAARPASRSARAPLRQGPCSARCSAGIMLFFLLEKLVLWRHCHTHDCEAHGMAAPMVIIGDAFHNFLDGVVIGTAVRTSIPLGVSTALAVATHEIPQELGDMAILLHAGYSRRKALVLNLVSGAVGGARRGRGGARARVGAAGERVRAVGRRGRISVCRDGRSDSRSPSRPHRRDDASSARARRWPASAPSSGSTHSWEDIDVRAGHHPLPQAAGRSARAPGCASRVPARAEGEGCAHRVWAR